MVVDMFLWMQLACAFFTKNEDPSSPDEKDVVVEKQIPPLLEISSPNRGDFILSNDIVTTGSILEGSSQIDRLLINQEEISVVDGAFDFSLFGGSGINLLHYRVEAEDGERSVDSIAVYKSPFHPPEESVPFGIRFQVGQDLLDDGDPDLDDLASIGENLLNDLDIAEIFVGQTYEVAGFDIIPTGLSHDEIDLQIQCGETLMMFVELNNIQLDFTVDTLIDLNGSATSDSILMSMELDAVIEDGVVQVIPDNTETSFTNMAVNIDYVPGLAENLIVGWAQTSIEEMLTEEAETIVADLSAEYLNSFALDTELFAGVSLQANLASLDVGEEGLRIIADGIFYGPVIKSFPDEVGSAIVSEDPPPWPLSTTKPFAAAISGDLANQLMFAAWATGFFDDIELSGILLQGLAGDAVPPPIGPVETLRLNLALPPSLHKPSVDDMTADIAIGEWQMHFIREDGEEIDYRINLRAGVNAIVDEGRIRLIPDNRPSKIDLGVATLLYPEYLDQGDLSALGRLMVPSLLSSVESFLPSIELPVIALGEFSDTLEGEELAITTAEISVTEQSWALIEAELK
jgi:hypothetical protein